MNIQINVHPSQEIQCGLTHRFGFRFDKTRSRALDRAISRRSKALSIDEIQKYLLLLRSSEGEWARLAEEITVHETSFFRHKGQFRILSEKLLPELVRQRAALRRLRLWSAACATGEEAYALAISIHELNLPPDWQVEIVATDLSSKALDAAANACYAPRKLHNLSSEQLQRYFEPALDGLQLKKEISSMVRFERFNLTQTGLLPDYLQNMDIIFCENVLIYFEPDAVRQAVSNLRASLSMGGFLFLGFAETLHGMSEGFETLSFEDAFLYKRSPTSKTPHTPVRVSSSIKPHRHPGSIFSKSSQKIKPISRNARRSAPAALNPSKPQSLRPDFQQQVNGLIDRGDFKGAERLCREELAENPDSKPAVFTLARLYAAQERDFEAIGLLRSLLSRDPLHAASYILLGILCYRQGELEEAFSQFQHAVYLSPESPLAYFYQGNIYQQWEQPHAARQAYTNALRMAENFKISWDSGFTPATLIQVCKRSIDRLQQQN